MWKRYNYRIYPSSSQQDALKRWFGCSRYVWNKALRDNTLHTKKELDATLPLLKSEHPWLKEPMAISLQQVHTDFEKAIISYKRGITNYPRLKTSKDEQSIRFPMRLVVGDRHKKTSILNLPKLGKVKMRISRPLPESSSCTIKRLKSGVYIASFVVKNVVKNTTSYKDPVGVDLGIKDLATLSNGIVFPKLIDYNHNVKINYDKIKHHRKHLSETQYGSNRQEKIKRAITKLSVKIHNQRLDYLHKVSRELSKYPLVVFEKISVRKIVKANTHNPSLANKLRYAGWYTLVELTKYKLNDEDNLILKVNPYNTSKTCHLCQTVHHVLTLNHREWECVECGAIHDRDVNAAKNILGLGLTEFASRHG